MRHFNKPINVLCVLYFICVSSIAHAQNDIRKDDPASKAKTRELKSPLLRGLQQSLSDSQAIGESGSTDVLLNQLEQADVLLFDARMLNQLAFRHVNRQQRIGRAALSPHVLLITVDRLGWGDLGCYGQKEIQTPHMDSLATKGMRFNQYYAGHSDNVAARWCLQNGRTGFDLKRGIENRFVLSNETKTLASLMWDSGYLTAFFGYWGNGDRPTNHGYESWSGFLNAKQAMSRFPETIQVDSANVRIVGNKNQKQTVSADSMLSSELTSWFKHNRRTRRQFFVHFNVSAFADVTNASAQLSATDYQHRIETADKTVGVILDTIRKMGVANRTMIVLVANSGPHLKCKDAAVELDSSGGLTIDESQLSEGNLRVPLIVRWPGSIQPAAETEHVCAACDIVPTLLATAVSNAKPRTDGISFTPTLRGSKQAKHQILYWESGVQDIGQAVRRDNWKAVRKPGTREVLLFELSKDKTESNNVAKEYPKVLATLIKK